MLAGSQPSECWGWGRGLVRCMVTDRTFPGSLSGVNRQVRSEAKKRGNLEMKRKISKKVFSFKYFY